MNGVDCNVQLNVLCVEFIRVTEHICISIIPWLCAADWSIAENFPGINVRILIEIPLRFVPKGPIEDDINKLVKIMGVYNQLNRFCDDNHENIFT